MSYSTSASIQFAAPHRKRPSRKGIPNHIFGTAAIACLVIGCGWTLHANVFGAGVYPSMAGGNYDAPVIRRSQSVAARNPQTIVNSVFASLPEPAPAVTAIAVAASTSTLRFDDRFAAAAPQAVDPAPQAEAPKLVSLTASVDATKPKPIALQPAPAKVASLAPAADAVETKPAKASVKDMAQRAKAAVMSIASGKPNMVEKLWGKDPAQGGLLAYASADVSATGSIGGAVKEQNPMLGGSPPYDRSTAVYDISAQKVYLPDGTVLEAHSGLGAKMDDVRFSHVRMQGVTPPHIYDLKPREALFHGVPALRLTPIGGEDKIFGRNGLLAHTYMLGGSGGSNGCVSFKDYYAFLDAYRNRGIRRLAVVAKVQ
jgi:hypothetical protein